MTTPRTYWKTVWNWLDGDCGDFPGEFDSEEAANDAGADWVAEAEADWGPDAGASYWVHRHEVSEDGTLRVYDEDDGKLVYTTPATTPAPTTLCQWFALCTNEATTTRSHPVLKEVPICDRCNAKVEALS